MKRSIILHSIGAICLSLMLFSCGQPTAETKPVIKDVTETVFASGSLVADGMYSLTAQTTGYLTQLSFEEGDIVDKGQV
ncbi:MAG: transporter, partial [Bacteroidota bacterium]